MPEQSGFLPEATIYAHQPDRIKLLKGVDTLLTNTDAELKIIVFVTRRDAIEGLTKGVHGFTVNVEYASRDVAVAQIGRTCGRKQPMYVDGKFALLRHREFPIVYLALTVDSPEYFRHVLPDFWLRRFPPVVAPLLSSQQMERLLASLDAAAEGLALRLRRISSRSRITSPGARKEIESHRKWTDLSLSEAFLTAKERDEWITSVAFELVPTAEVLDIVSSPLPVEGVLYRHSTLKCRREFALFWAHVLDPICRIAYEQAEFYSRRARSETPQLATRPLFLEFEYPVLEDSTHRERLVSVLGTLSCSSCSIVHRNPYVHVSMVDYRDGSSYDVWVLSASRVTVVPQMRATHNSLARLCGHIFRYFQEGQLRDYREVYPES